MRHIRLFEDYYPESIGIPNFMYVFEITMRAPNHIDKYNVKLKYAHVYKENLDDALDVLISIPDFEELQKDGVKELLRGPHIERCESGKQYYISDEPEY